jgi:hypothetical protein
MGAFLHPDPGGSGAAHRENQGAIVNVVVRGPKRSAPTN